MSGRHEITQTLLDHPVCRFMIKNNRSFKIQSPYKAAGDQPCAIKEIVLGLQSGLASQTLLGVTGSGKTFTIANVLRNRSVQPLF